MLSVDVESMETGEDHPPADDGHLHEDENHTFSVVEDDHERLLNLEVEMAELMIPGDNIINIDELTTELNDCTQSPMMCLWRGWGDEMLPL